MAEFVLNGDASSETDFVRGFIEAMFFTCTKDQTIEEWFTDERVEANDGDDGLPVDSGYDDIHPDSLDEIRTYCERWQANNAALLAAAYATGYSEDQAGRDLWFTMNGHGVGFWSREELEEGGLGDKLSDAARYHEVDPFFGGHVDYGDAPFVHLDI